VRVVVSCPAKINTFLAVGPPDATGYHPIRTIFQAISLCDTLTVSDESLEPAAVAVRHEDKRLTLTCDWEGLPEDNTIAKARRLLSEYGDLPHLWVHLEKRIPHESGLGGGSSDAAGLLRAASSFAMAPFAAIELHDVAIAVGADVPFFLVGGKARGEGYGEKLTPAPDDPERWLVVAKPDVGCSTAGAYQALDANPYPWRHFPEGDELYNDFERVMPCESDDWMEHLQLLGATGVGLSGSGSAVFGFFADQGSAERAHEDLSARRGVRSGRGRPRRGELPRKGQS